MALPAPTRDELHAVLQQVLGAHWARRDLDAGGVEHLVDSALGLTLEQARRVFTRAVVADGVLDARDVGLVLEEKKAIIATSGALEFLEPETGLADLGGLDALKGWLRQRERGFTAAARAFGLPPPKGIALIGLPGTGKSLTAKTIGAMWGLPLLRLDIGAIYSSFMGESERRAREALRLAEAIAPCVVWIDELDKAIGTGANDQGTSTRVVGTLLTWMSEKTAPCFVVATANDISRLPPRAAPPGPLRRDLLPRPADAARAPRDPRRPRAAQRAGPRRPRPPGGRRCHRGLRRCRARPGRAGRPGRGLRRRPGPDDGRPGRGRRLVGAPVGGPARAGRRPAVVAGRGPRPTGEHARLMGISENWSI
jgi:hypothetical protein